jgi:hypothetical protein
LGEVVRHDVSQLIDDGGFVCPVCGFEYTQVVDVALSDRGDYRNGWDGRGKLLTVHFVGECGHSWDVCMGFHKGFTSIFGRSDPNDVPASEDEV